MVPTGLQLPLEWEHLFGPNASTAVTLSGDTLSSTFGYVLLNYADGSNSTSISGTNIGPITPMPNTSEELFIYNPTGGSTTLLGTTAPVTVNGGMYLWDGANPTGIGEPNIISFNNTIVQGFVDMKVAGGDSYISVLSEHARRRFEGCRADDGAEHRGRDTG